MMDPNHLQTDDESPAVFAIRGMIVLLAIGFAIYGLVGVFAGYLIIPYRSQTFSVEGLGARIGGIGLVLFCLAMIIGITLREKLPRVGLRINFAALILGILLLVVGFVIPQT